MSIVRSVAIMIGVALISGVKCRPLLAHSGDAAASLLAISSHTYPTDFSVNPNSDQYFLPSVTQLAQGQVPPSPLPPPPAGDDIKLPSQEPPLKIDPATTETTSEPPANACPPLTVRDGRGMDLPQPLVQVTVDGKPIVITLQGMTAFTPASLLTLPSLQVWQTAPPPKSAPLVVSTPLTPAEFEVLYQGIVEGISQRYITEGYITSQAIAVSSPPIDNGEAPPNRPVQTDETRAVNEKVVSDSSQRLIVIEEGQLEFISVVGNGRLRLSYICQRVALGSSAPLNIIQIEEQLRLLQIDPLLKSVDASLLPTGKVGLSRLAVEVAEAYPFAFNFGFDNYAPISLGTERGSVSLDYKNPSGLGDRVRGSYYFSTTGGLSIGDIAYQIPLNPTNGTLEFRAVPTETRITQPPFDVFNIKGSNPLYEIRYRQPIWRSLQDEFALSIGLRHQNGVTLGLNRPDLGDSSRTTVVQFGQDYLRRDATGLWLGQSLMNFGTGLLDATVNPDPFPSANFFSWLGQIQRLQQLGKDNLLIFRSELQLSPDPLLSDYLFIIGGAQSLRGYRQNARSGDNGIRISIEDRITVARNAQDESIFEIVPFVDFGAVWNSSGNPTTLPPNTVLVGPGLGLIWREMLGIPGLSIRFDYGIPVVNLPDRSNNWQNDGLYFQFNYQPPFGRSATRQNSMESKANP